MPKMNAARHYFKVLWTVVVFDAIDMVNSFVRRQIATQNFLHHQAMLKHVVTKGAWVMFGIDLNIAPMVVPSALPILGSSHAPRLTHAAFRAVSAAAICAVGDLAKRYVECFFAYFANASDLSCLRLCDTSARAELALLGVFGRELHATWAGNHA